MATGRSRGRRPTHAATATATTPALQELLLNLARAADVEGKTKAMFAGEKINTTENRAVFHPALRAPKGSEPMLVDGVDMVTEVHTVLDAMADFSDRVRSGAWLGSTGKPLTTVYFVGRYRYSQDACTMWPGDEVTTGSPGSEKRYFKPWTRSLVKPLSFPSGLLFTPHS